jgi:hypothetical protein
LHSITLAVEEFSTLPQKQPFNSMSRQILFLLTGKSSTISNPFSVVTVGAIFSSMTVTSSIDACVVVLAV